jgi:hypothetical protein
MQDRGRGLRDNMPRVADCLGRKRNITAWLHNNVRGTLLAVTYMHEPNTNGARLGICGSPGTHKLGM